LGIGDWGLGIGPNPQSPLLFNSQFKKFLIGFKKNIILNNKIQDILKIIYNLNTSEYFIMIHPLIGYLISIFV